MSRVFDLLLSEKIVAFAAVPAFQRYHTDPAFKTTVDDQLLMQDRVSLATLADPLPSGMSEATMINVVYEMRHRCRSALEPLRDLDLRTASSRESV